MRISLIAALDEAGGIGIENRMPWRLPEDARSFRRITMGHHVISGRKTFDSLGKPLPGRKHIILSRNPNYPVPPDCVLMDSLESGLRLAETRGEEEVIIIGGAQVYADALPLAQRMYLTRVKAVFPVDVKFPAVNWAEWTLVQANDYPADEKHPFPFTIQIWDRK